MKTILKVCLKRVLRYKDPKITEGYVKSLGQKLPEDIINELYDEGRITDKDIAMEIVRSYNEKAASMTMSGYVVRTGLVKLSAGMRGLVYDKKWSRLGNKVDVQFETDSILDDAAKNTIVELDLSEIENDFTDEVELDDQTYMPSFRLGESRILTTEREPACGIFFRQWLCKSV